MKKFMFSFAALCLIGGMASAGEFEGVKNEGGLKFGEMKVETAAPVVIGSDIDSVSKHGPLDYYERTEMAQSEKEGSVNKPAVPPVQEEKKEEKKDGKGDALAEVAGAVITGLAVFGARAFVAIIGMFTHM